MLGWWLALTIIFSKPSISSRLFTYILNDRWHSEASFYGPRGPTRIEPKVSSCEPIYGCWSACQKQTFINWWWRQDYSYQPSNQWLSRKNNPNGGRSSRRIELLSDSDKDSLHASYILNAMLPHFKVPSMKLHEATDDHIQNYKTTICNSRGQLNTLCAWCSMSHCKKLWGSDITACPLDPSIPSRTSHMPSAISLQQKRRRKNSTHLLLTRQGKKGKLCGYIHHFNLEKPEMGDCSDDVAMAAFTKGFRDKDLIKLLYNKPPEDFEDIMSGAKTHMLTNEALQSTDDEAPDATHKPSKRLKQRKCSNECIDWSKSPPPLSRCFTLLNCPRSEILNYIA